MGILLAVLFLLYLTCTIIMSMFGKEGFDGLAFPTICVGAVGVVIALLKIAWWISVHVSLNT